MIFSPQQPRTIPFTIPVLALASLLTLHQYPAAGYPYLPAMLLLLGLVAYQVARRWPVLSSHIIESALVIIAAIAVFQFIDGNSLPQSIVLSSNALGSVMVWGSIRAYAKGRKVQAALFAVVLAVSLSRAALLSLIVAAAVYAILKTRLNKWLGMGLAGVALFSLAGSQIVKPYPVIEYRLMIWRIAGQGFIDRPWLGNGVGSFPDLFTSYAPDFQPIMNHAHNLPLQIASDLGVLGLTLTGLLIISLLRRSKPHSAAGWSLIAALVVQFMTDYVLWIPGMVLILAALLPELPRIEEKQAEYSKQARLGALYGSLLLSLAGFLVVTTKDRVYSDLVIVGIASIIFSAFIPIILSPPTPRPILIK